MAATQIVLLFLILHTLPHESIWQEWLQGAEDKLHVIIHAKYPEMVTSSWSKARLMCSHNGVPVTHRPEWGSIELLRAMMSLLQYAYTHYPQSTHMCFLSESCIPIIPAREFLAQVGQHPPHWSWLDVKQRPNNGYSAFQQFVRVTKPFAPMAIRKSDQWGILSRSHVSLLLSQDQTDKFERTHAPDELYIPTMLHQYGVLSDSMR